MHLIEKEVEETIVNFVLKFNINDLQNIKRNKKAHCLLLSPV